MPTTSLAIVPLPMATEVPSTEAAPYSCWDAIQISTILLSLLSHLPPVIEAIEIASTFVVPPLNTTTCSMPLVEDTEVDTFLMICFSMPSRSSSLS